MACCTGLPSHDGGEGGTQVLEGGRMMKRQDLEEALLPNEKGGLQKGSKQL